MFPREGVSIMPLDSSALVKSAGTQNGLFEAMLGRLPETVRSSLSEVQLSALREASEALKWGKHPVDIRLSIPSLFNRYYLVLIAGKERRGKTRLDEERKRHPFSKLYNFLFIGALVALGVYLVVFAETLLFIAHFSDFLD